MSSKDISKVKHPLMSANTRISHSEVNSCQSFHSHLQTLPEPSICDKSGIKDPIKINSHMSICRRPLSQVPWPLFGLSCRRVLRKHWPSAGCTPVSLATVIRLRHRVHEDARVFVVLHIVLDKRMTRKKQWTNHS